LVAHLSEDFVTCIAGNGGAGKPTLAMARDLSIAIGTSFLQTSRTSRVAGNYDASNSCQTAMVVLRNVRLPALRVK
jgi:ABC-type uncharacterized transport system ATPase component